MYDDQFIGGPMPSGKPRPTHAYDYGAIEDRAGVEFTHAMYIVAAFIGMHLFLRDFFYEPLWIILTTGLSVASWWYFRQYFTAVGDQRTAKLVNLIIGSMILYGFTNAYVYSSSSGQSIFTDGIRNDVLTSAAAMYGQVSFLISIMNWSILLSAVAIFVAALQLLLTNRKHAFPLKRIAVSAAICVPLYILLSISMNFHLAFEVLGLFQWLFGTSQGLPRLPIIAMLFLMLPYIFLLQFFYRGNKYDRTPSSSRY